MIVKTLVFLLISRQLLPQSSQRPQKATDLVDYPIIQAEREWQKKVFDLPTSHKQVIVKMRADHC